VLYNISNTSERETNNNKFFYRRIQWKKEEVNRGTASRNKGNDPTKQVPEEVEIERELYRNSIHRNRKRKIENE